MQGAATSVYAAVSPDLDGQSGAYLVDCAPSSASKTASDPEQARIPTPDRVRVAIRCDPSSLSAQSTANKLQHSNTGTAQLANPKDQSMQCVVRSIRLV